MKKDRGFSLVEILLVIGAIFFVGMLIFSLPSSMASINRSKNTSIAREVANKQLDYLRKQGFVNLANGSNTFSDSSLSPFNQAEATYEVGDCPLEICSNGEKAKKVNVKVSWKEQGDEKNVELVTIISEGGLGQ